VAHRLGRDREVDVRDEDVLAAVTGHVGDFGGHPVPFGRAAQISFLEGPVAPADVQHVAVVVVGDVNVRVAVAGEVGETRREAPAVAVDAGVVDALELAACIFVQDVGIAVVVMDGPVGREVAGGLALAPVARLVEEDVPVAVAVVVRGRRAERIAPRCRGRRRRVRKSPRRCGRDDRPVGRQQEDVLPAVAVVVDDRGALERPIQGAEARRCARRSLRRCGTAPAARRRWRAGRSSRPYRSRWRRCRRSRCRSPLSMESEYDSPLSRGGVAELYLGWRVAERRKSRP